MHASVFDWVCDLVSDIDALRSAKTLEVGSMNVNGSVRGLFKGSYVGVDMREGDGVDMVARASELPFDKGEFECVVCTEMLEHDPEPWRSVPEMARVLAPGGRLILTTRGIGFPLHEHPSDYWRFTAEGVARLIELAGLELIDIRPDPQPDHPGVFALARKP